MREPGGLRVTLLGSGSPRPNLARCQPAALVEWGSSGRVLVDAGDGVVAQLMRADVSLATVQHVAITHLHWDHILGYPAFVWGSWNVGRGSLVVWGPSGTRDMHARLVADFYAEQAAWAIDIGFPPSGWHDIAVHDVAPGWSVEVDGCRIEAGAVVHPPMAAISYRFTFEDRTIVISGDTAACDELVEFASGADVLVVDACASDPPRGATPERAALIRRLREFHAAPQECVDMAARAGVGRVVLTHHLPEAELDDLDVSRYSGTVTIGADLETFEASG
jgi:ribonuclease Z